MERQGPYRAAGISVALLLMRQQQDVKRQNRRNRLAIMTILYATSIRRRLGEKLALACLPRVLSYRISLPPGACGRVRALLGSPYARPRRRAFRISSDRTQDTGHFRDPAIRVGPQAHAVLGDREVEARIRIWYLLGIAVDERQRESVLTLQPVGCRQLDSGVVHPDHLRSTALRHPLFDDLVHKDEEVRGNREPQGLGRLQVNDQLKPHGLLHGQVPPWLGSFQDLAHQRGSAPPQLGKM
jgi:hypothetical protein